MSVQNNIPIEDLESLLHARFSCRAFRPDPVPTATIERLLAAAQRTPSWCNSQPWQVIVTTGDGTERLRTALVEAVRSGAAGASDFPFPREYTGVYDTRRKESGFALYNSLGIAKGDKAAYAKQMLENFRSSARRMSRSSQRMKPSAFTEQSTVAATSTISCSRPKRLDWMRLRRPRSPCARRPFATTSG